MTFVFASVFLVNVYVSLILLYVIIASLKVCDIMCL